MKRYREKKLVGDCEFENGKNREFDVSFECVERERERDQRRVFLIEIGEEEDRERDRRGKRDTVWFRCLLCN